MFDRYKYTLEQILDSIQAILIYSKDLSYEEYLSDRKTRDAIYRNIEIIGEAANRLPNEFKKYNDIIDWKKLVGLRNVLIHNYDAIDDLIIWRTIDVILPGMEKIIVELIQQL